MVDLEEPAELKVDLVKYVLNITARNGIPSGSGLFGTSKASSLKGTHIRR